MLAKESKSKKVQNSDQKTTILREKRNGEKYVSTEKEDKEVSGVCSN